MVRRGGKIGLANWTPNGFIGAIFKIIGEYVLPPAGVKSAALWGTDEHLEHLFGQDVGEIEVVRKTFDFCYRSADYWLEVSRNYSGPIHKAFAALDEEQQSGLGQDIKDLIRSMNRSGDASMVVPSEYLEVVITR